MLWGETYAVDVHVIQLELALQLATYLLRPQQANLTLLERVGDTLSLLYRGSWKSNG